MRLKNILIVVKDIEASQKFYTELFGLSTVLNRDGNVILTEGLVLQDKGVWEKAIGKESIPYSNSVELFFEERDVDAFAVKLKDLYPDINYVTQLKENEIGQKLVRFYDLDGNLIEVKG